MLKMISCRRGCGKCGKAGAFFAEAFPSSWWKSSRRSCRRPPLPISTAATFSTALRARRFVRLAVQETDIRNGKDSSEVRSRFQTPTRRANRSRPTEHGAGRARLSTRAQRAGTVASSVSEHHVDRFSIGSGTAVGSREPEAKGQDWRPGDANGPFKKIADLGSTAEKRRYIRDHREELGSVSKTCQVTGLASSSYYYNPDQQYQRRCETEDEDLRHQIEQIHEEFPGYGYRRVVRELDRRGVRVNGKRVRRVMKKFGLTPITWRAFIRTTDSRHDLPIYPNLLKHRQVRGINEVWVADITYIGIRSGFVYL